MNTLSIETRARNVRRCRQVLILREQGWHIVAVARRAGGRYIVTLRPPAKAARHG